MFVLITNYLHWIHTFLERIRSKVKTVEFKNSIHYYDVHHLIV